jgi:hypothetical protein
MISCWQSVFLFLLLLAPMLAGADEKGAPAGGAAKKRQLTAAELRDFYTNPAGRIVTDWAELEIDSEIWESFTKAGYCTVLSEGKLEEGRLLFRKGYKHVSDFYPDATRTNWHTYTGMSQKSFDTHNRELLKDGFTLMRMQRFIDGDGEFRFCAIWARFTPAPPKK